MMPDFIRRRISYANVVVTLALVFAMSGGALAASRYLITSTKQISPKVVKELKGKSGAPGAAGKEGPAGPAGKEGAAGKAGLPGKEGAAGKNGEPGAGGTGATTAAFSGSQHGCKEGGAEVRSASAPAFLCNGEKGAAGQTGFTEKLPVGKTETGTWHVTAPKGAGVLLTSISFPIPLPSGLGATAVHFVGPGVTNAACTGTAAGPTAAEGNLCVYQTWTFGLLLEPSTETASVNIYAPQTTLMEMLEGKAVQSAGISGAQMTFNASGEEEHYGEGSWAVTP